MQFVVRGKAVFTVDAVSNVPMRSVMSSYKYQNKKLQSRPDVLVLIRLQALLQICPTLASTNTIAHTHVRLHTTHRGKKVMLDSILHIFKISFLLVNDVLFDFSVSRT